MVFFKVSQVIQTCSQEQESLGSHGGMEKGNDWGWGKRAEGMATYFGWSGRVSLNIWSSSRDTENKKQQNIPCKANRKCKGPRVTLNSIFLRNSKKAGWLKIRREGG